MSASRLVVDKLGKPAHGNRVRWPAPYAVKTGDGADGIAKAQAERYDLIVTDLNMPIMDGLTMIEELRKSPAQMGIPIIFLSTESNAGLKQRAKAAGATGWLTKPFNPEQIVGIIKKVLGR